MLDTKVICIYENIDSSLLLALKTTISWFCIVNRHEAPGVISLFRGLWKCDVFRLKQLEPVKWVSCWVKMISVDVVVPLNSVISENPFLYTSFSLACQLAYVHAPLHVEGGFIWHGGFSSLVPMARHANGFILWHVEALEGDDDFFRLHDIEALRGAWYQTMDMNVYRIAQAILGWSHGGEIRLASTWAAGLGRAHFFKLSPGFQAIIQPPAIMSASANLTITPANCYFAQKTVEELYPVGMQRQQMHVTSLRC